MPVPESPVLAGALLLVVDLQAPFLAAIPGSAEILRRTSLALEAAAGLGLPVAFTEQVPAKLGPTVPQLLALAPAPRVYAKDTFSALAAPGLRDWMLENKIEHLLLAGIETPVCIYQTALEALAADLQVTLLTDCLGARRADDARAATDYLARQGCHPLPTETIFYSILQTTTHPFFRDFTKLVKKYAGV